MSIHRVLIIGAGRHVTELTNTTHYSLVKDWNFAQGMVRAGKDVFFLTKNKSGDESGLHNTPIKSITDEFISSLDLIVFIKDADIKHLLEESVPLSSVFEKKRPDRPRLVCKTDGYNWLDDLNWTGQKLYDSFDLLAFQTDRIIARFLRTYGVVDVENKIFPSAMAVPDELPPKQPISPFQSNRCNLIYMGRLVHKPVRYDFIRDVMAGLNSDYFLTIYAGSFIRTENDQRIKCGTVHGDEISWLNTLFSGCSNIEVCRPVSWEDHWNYLYHADIGFDLSPKGALKAIANGDNAKLYEYMAAGLPSITDKYTGNAFLIEKYDAGIVTQDTEVFTYVENIKKMRERVYDRESISQKVRKEHGWSVRAKEILDRVESR